MKGLKKTANKLLKKHGWLIASFAFVFCTIPQKTPVTIQFIWR